MKNINIQKNRQLGFSLIEVLVSLFLFSIAMVGVMGMMNMEMKKTMIKRNETVAGQLAQEGIELVRNIRDNNFINHPDDAFFGIDVGNNQRIDYISVNLNSAADKALYLNTSTGLYAHNNSGSDTVFQRKIIITGAVQRKITSVVTWEGAALPDNESDLSNCNASSRCFYVQIILSKNWGRVE